MQLGVNFAEYALTGQHVTNWTIDWVKTSRYPRKVGSNSLDTEFNIYELPSYINPASSLSRVEYNIAHWRAGLPEPYHGNFKLITSGEAAIKIVWQNSGGVNKNTLLSQRDISGANTHTDVVVPIYPQDGEIVITIYNSSGDVANLTEMHFVHEDHLDDFHAGQIFTPEVRALQENFAVWRYMKALKADDDAMGAVGLEANNFSDPWVMTLDKAIWSGSVDSRVTARAVATLSGNSVANVELVNPGFGYTNATVVFDDPETGSNTATATLVINSASFKVESITLDNPGDGYSNTPIITISDADVRAIGQRHMPYEAILKHHQMNPTLPIPWINILCNADDAYVTGIANLLATYDLPMVYIEYGNEVFHAPSSPNQGPNGYWRDQSVLRWGDWATNGYSGYAQQGRQWLAWRLAHIIEIVNGIHDSSKITWVYADQGNWTGWPNFTFNAPEWDAEDASNSDIALHASWKAGELIDMIAVNAYFGNDWESFIDDVANFDQPDKMYDALIASINSRTAACKSVKDTLEARSGWNANTFSYVAYESGQGLYPDNNNTPQKDAFRALQSTQQMNDLYDHWLDRCENTSEFDLICHYADVDATIFADSGGGNGYWGFSSYYGHDWTTTKKGEALANFLGMNNTPAQSYIANSWGEKENAGSGSGTIAIAANGLVSGTGTDFINEVYPGNFIRTNGKFYRVADVMSSTVMHVAAGRLGKDISPVSSGASFIISQKPLFLSVSSDQYEANSVFFVDIEESGNTNNIVKGLDTPGWVAHETYTNSKGITRYKNEVLVTMKKTKAEAGDAEDDVVEG